ncbi:MAG: glycosyl hydrolase family 65 protein [Planctomycetota bacterium]
MSAEIETWTIVEEAFEARHCRHYEALLAIGSGVLQQRASFEEGLDNDPQDREYLHLSNAPVPSPLPKFKSRVGTYLPGLTGPHPTCGEELINLPALHGLIVYEGNERLEMEQSHITAYRRQLDLRTGRLSREFTWHTRRGSTVAVRFERFISAQRKHVMALRCRFRHLDGPPAELRLLGTLDADVRTNGFDHFDSITFTGEHEPVTVELRTNRGDYVAAAALMICDAGIVWNIESGPRWAAVTGVHVLDPGTELVVDKYASMTSSRHVQGAPLDAARNLVWNATGAGYERLARESDEIWQQRWDQTDVVIAGDPASQQALRLSLYHLLRAAVELDDRHAIDPTGASGEACCGRYFRNIEMFMLPFYLYTRPEIGRTLAGFRISSLAGARRNAQRDGYPGARYARESCPLGDEHCPDRYFADHGIHVTADVAYGLWHAHLANPADTLFLSRVTRVLTACARYWCQRVTYNARQDEYDLLMTVGPDEYTPFCRNNAYTNHLVALSLHLTNQAWDELRASDSTAAEALQTELELTAEELSTFASIAGKLHLPYDAERRLVLQSDDFFEREPLDFNRYWPDRTQPLDHAVSRERLYRSQAIRQADVIHLLALLPHQFDRQQMQVAYQTYEPLTSHDSSLSRCLHATVAAWIGDADAALRMWDASVRHDLTPGVAADGFHLACAGGNWQAAIFGFAGVRGRMQSDILSINPHLPPRWSALRFPLVWDTQPLYITIEPGRVTIDHRGATPLETLIFGRQQQIPPGRQSTFNHQP